MERINFLLNTNNHEYNFDQSELHSLNEAKLLLEKSYNLYALYEINNMLLGHILRRIEYYSTEYFLSDLKANGQYQENEPQLFKRWEQYDTKEIFQHAFKHNLIDDITLDLLFALYHSKQHIQENDSISIDYISSFLTLFEQRLFQKEFIKAKIQYNRRKTDSSEHNKRKEDQINPQNFVSKDEEIRVRSGINPFSSPLQEPVHTIEKYG